MIKEWNINPNIDIEIRIYPEGTKDRKNFKLYTGGVSNLNNYVQEIEKKIQDVLKEQGGDDDDLESRAEQDDSDYSGEEVDLSEYDDEPDNVVNFDETK
jgi:hypothetical protein